MHPSFGPPKSQQTFDQLKEAMLNIQVLAYADFSKPFKMHKMLVLGSLGAAIAQEQDRGSLHMQPPFTTN